MKRRAFKWMPAVALGTLMFGWGCAEPEENEANAPNDEVGKHRQEVIVDTADLDFILTQIRIAEQHAAGTPMASLLQSPLVPYGLRTVSGEFNNVTPGREHFGSSDQIFPRLLPPFFRDGELSIDLDGPGPMLGGLPTSYSHTGGLVFDSQPRVISTLIVDASANNPAAAAVAARTEGSVANVDGRGTFFIPNAAPDVGLSAPFNLWFTFFGQFFDHGVDLVKKGGSGTVIMPLNPDDPLFDPAGSTNFMLLTRATNQPGVDGVLGTADDVHEHINTDSPFVDQNQTYTAHPSHQVFLRSYVFDATGRPVSDGRMLDGARGGMANWGEVKAQARTKLGIELRDGDVRDVPLVRADPYGRFVRGPNGFPLLATTLGDIEGNPAAPISTVNALRSGHMFLDDIAHAAVPGPGLVPDADTVVSVGPIAAGEYDNELLDAHFCTGDPRGNENIALTAVHFIFHAEHNRFVDHVKDTVLATANPTYIAQWLLPGANQADGIQPLEWNGERLFQAARFGTEMQYQHLVFEEFARKVQPGINVIGEGTNYDSTLDPAIVAEFAHVVYRFGHSMLTETVPRINADGTANDAALIQAFINPLEFMASGATDAEATAAIIRGATREVGNEIDEFVTSAVRNNLLGLPLDLAAINLARGRDTGVPPLNEARRRFYSATGFSTLRPYLNWQDFGFGLRNPESLVNFVAAYGRHPTISSATVLADKRAAAEAILGGGVGAPADSFEFVTSTGAWAGVETGVNLVDFWVGGLAEKPRVFGGMLGSTFNFVFEMQLEALQNADRLYYLNRTAGLNFLTRLEENTFSEMVMRNTGLKHLPADIFSRPAYTFELANLGSSGTILDDPATPDVDESELLFRMADGTVRYTGAEHVVFGGTPGNDRIESSEGDDTIYGDEGDDDIEGGDGNDQINGGPGDDVITDLHGVDVIRGGEGNDVIHGGQGEGDILLGGDGSDFIVAGDDPTETFGGPGDDFILGSAGFDEVLGNDGNDWIEGGPMEDLISGDHAQPFQSSPVAGHDVIIGGQGDDDIDAESGDDIIVVDEGVERAEGMLGFDWVTHKGHVNKVDADMLFKAPAQPDIDNIRDRFDRVEGLSGWDGDDILRGDDRISDDLLDVDPIAGFNDAINGPDQIALIDGLQEVLGAGVTSFSGGNIILGGAGSDIIEGRGGDDIIDGDRWLNVRISVRDAGDNEIAYADMMAAPLKSNSGPLPAHLAGLTLLDAVFKRLINPGQLRIVREILTTPPGSFVDTAVYSDSIANYDVVRGADGVIRVNHVRGTQTDGSDQLRNIEVLQFADGTVPTFIVGTDVTPPAAVFGLTAAGSDSTTVLSWVAPLDAVSVRVLRSTIGPAPSPTPTSGWTIVFDGPGTTFSDTGLVNGTNYWYTAFARDTAGNYSAPTSVMAMPSTDLPPAVRIVSPTPSVVPGGQRIDIVASASDDLGIAFVEFYVDGVLEDIDTTPPYDTRWRTENGRHTLTAVAQDSAGNRSTHSIELCVSSFGFCAPVPPNDRPPRVSLSFPLDGAVIPRGNVVDIQADASDDRSGMVVEFYVDGVLRRRDGAARYHVNWTASVPGPHQITALAIDRQGQRTWHTINITVR